MDDFVKTKYSTKDRINELHSLDDIPFQTDEQPSTTSDAPTFYEEVAKGMVPDKVETTTQKDDGNIEEGEKETSETAKDSFAPKVINVSEVRRKKRAVPNPEKRNPRRSEFRLSPKIRVFFTVVVIGSILGVAAYFLQKNYFKWNDYTVEWSRDIRKGSFVGYERFRGSLLKYSRDAAVYMDQEGKELWTVGYEMSNPFAMASDDYIAIADKQKNKIIIFDKDGKVAEINTINPISRFVITKYGVIATIEEDIASTYINFYNRDGKQLQITVKSKMSGNGYPTDLSISPDGKLLMVGFEYIESGKLKGRVVFYDFSDASASTDNRVIAGFDDEFKDSLIGRVKFIGKNNAFAVSNRGLSFFKINDSKPTLHKSYHYEEDILSIAYSDRYIAVITKGNVDGKTKTLTVYNPSGSSVFSKKFEKNYKSFDIDGDYFFLYTDRDCTIFNQLGTEKFSKTLDFDISIISKTGDMNKFIVTGPSQMKCIQLK